MTEVVSTLSSGTLRVPYMTMTTQAILCPAPVLERDFEPCRIPGGADLWRSAGFYSPGNCFVGYEAMCTQTSPMKDGWPIMQGETVVRCVPEGYECNDQTKDQRFAVSDFDGTILSAPAFEIRWRSEDLTARPHPGVPILGPLPTGPPKPTNNASIPPSPPTTDFNPLSSESTNTLSSGFVPTAGAVAGIAVGSSLGLMALIMLVLLLTFQYRKRKLKLPDPLPGMDRQDSQEGSVRILTHVPVELEHKPLEPRELSSETQIPCEKPDRETPRDDTCVSRLPHISVNDIPAEMPGDYVSLSERLSRREAEGATSRKPSDPLKMQDLR